MVRHEGVTTEIMEGVMNLGSVNIVWYFLCKQQKFADETWQENVGMQDDYEGFNKVGFGEG